MRKKMKAPMTDHAIKLNINELAKLKVKGHDPEAVLNQSTRNSWKGLFEIKDKDEGLTHEERRRRFVEGGA